MDNSDNNMTTSNSPNPGAPRNRRIHPLVATAAGAVIVASLAATAAVTGLFPKASSTSSTSDQTQAAQVATQPAVTQPAEPLLLSSNNSNSRHLRWRSNSLYRSPTTRSSSPPNPPIARLAVR